MNELMWDAVKIIILVMVIAIIACIAIFIIYRSVIKRVSSRIGETYEEGGISLKREDISTYITFDDIQDGVVALDGYTRFTTAIEVQGYDLYNSEVDEQLMVEQRYTQLFDMLIDGDYLQMRYNPQLRDLSQYVESYSGMYEEVSRELYNKFETVNFLQKRVNKMERDEQTESEEYALNVSKINALYKEINSLTSQKNELESLATYTSNVSGENAQPDMHSSYVIEWIYNELENPFDEKLTQDEIYARAKTELRSMAISYISALGEAHLHARQVTSTERMLDIFRRHFRPVSGELFKVEQLLNGSVMDYVTASERDTSLIPNKNGRETMRLAEAHLRVISEKKEEVLKVE